MKLLLRRLVAVLCLAAFCSCSGRAPNPTVRDYSNSNPPMRITPQSVCIKQPNGSYKCSGGSTVPCPITSQTVATSPTNRSRVTIGVGEQVTLTSTGAGWSVTGDGTLSGTIGTVTLTAGDQGGTATVTIGQRTTCSSNSLDFNVIAPVAVLYQAVGPLYHHQGLAEIGTHANVYLQPDTVSFQYTYYRENQANFSANGSWLCWNAQGHTTSVSGVAVGPDSPGYGSMLAGGIQDWENSGTCSGQQVQTSSESVSIPMQYQTGSSGAVWYNVGNVLQSASETSIGALTLTKNNVNVSTTVNSPTSGY